MLEPVIALITWTLVVWAWMYALRIPAMQKAEIDPDDAKHPGSLSVLPSTVRSVADNYNHLHEQPTIFYALAFYTAGRGGGPHQYHAGLDLCRPAACTFPGAKPG